MGLTSDALYFAFHPYLLWKIVGSKLPYNAHEGYESTAEKVCFELLTQCTRSFSHIIKQIHPELRLPMCIFYLILRGIDSIEDDPSIPLGTKVPLLLDFKSKLELDGWVFESNHPKLKDRQVLMQFDSVIVEFKKMKPVYQAIIKDVTGKMGSGMAEFAREKRLEHGDIRTVEEYNLYCWYVAGLLGEGITRLFIEAGLGEPTLQKQSYLHDSASYLVQKSDTIRDIREDYDEGRCIWPGEIWSKHVNKFGEMFEPENLERALNCSSEMVLDALGHAKGCLSYLSYLREQSAFHFCAFLFIIALASLELCFRNPAVFERTIEISKRYRIRLFIESSQDLNSVCRAYCRYVDRIQKKNDPLDPNYLKINNACEEIKKFAQTLVDSERQSLHPAGLFTTRKVVTTMVAVSVLVLGAAVLKEAYFHSV